jgi:hypothetical protein
MHFLIIDQRMQMASQKDLSFPPFRLMDLAVNTEPIEIYVQLRHEETKELLQHISWTIPVNEKFVSTPVYMPNAEEKTVRLLSLGMIFHLVSILVSLLALIIHIVRIFNSCMTVEIKYSMIIKKFESGNSHLELNQKAVEIFKKPRLFDIKEEEKQGLLKAEAIQNDSGGGYEEMRRVSEKNTEESLPSQVSHYVEDEQGQVTRVMIKNVNKGVKEDFFISRDKFDKDVPVKITPKLTPKSKLK